MKILFTIYLITLWASFISFSVFIKRYNNPNGCMKIILNECYKDNSDKTLLPLETFEKKITNIAFIFIPGVNLVLIAFHILLIKADKKVTKELNELSQELEKRLKDLEDKIQKENLEELNQKLQEDLEKLYYSDKLED